MKSYRPPAKRKAAYDQCVFDAGSAEAIKSTSEPTATVGIFSEVLEAWVPGTTYEKRYSLFTHDGKVGFTRQANITAQAHQPPFSPGMESVYGIRPIPDDSGVYPYVYNMAASVGMRVREEDAIYRCIEDIQLLIWPPSQVPRYFELEV